MDYDIQEGLLKENSISARIYFLLLKRQASASEISEVMYGKHKVQLSNVLKAIEKLIHEGYVEEVLLSNKQKEEQGIDKRKKPYKSTYKPLLEYIEKKVNWRKETSEDRNKEKITPEDKQVLELIFKSKWFSKFFQEDFLKTQIGEVMITKNKEIISHCPIRFFAFFLEELFEISHLYQLLKFQKVKNQDILDSKNFDSIIEQNKQKITNETMTQMSKINSIVIKSLGHSKKEGKTAFDYYNSDSGILFIPLSLSEKLNCIGRVPLTISIYFGSAIQKVLKKTN